MTPHRDERGDGPRAPSRAIPRACESESCVVGSGHRQDGAGQCHPAGPRAAPGYRRRRSSGSRQRGCGVAPPLRQVRGVRGVQSTEQRTGPTIGGGNESHRRRARPGRTRVCRVGERQAFPGGRRPQCRRWRRRAPGPGSRAAEVPHGDVQGGDPSSPTSRRRGRRVRRQPSSHTDLRHEGGGLGRSVRTASDPAWPGRSMPRACGTRPGGRRTAPTARRLGKPVQHDQGRTRAAHFDMEGHARMSVQATFCRDPGRRIGRGRRHRCGDLPRLTVDSSGLSRPSAPGPCAAWTSGVPDSLRSVSPWQRQADGDLRHQWHGGGQFHPAVVEAHQGRVPLIVCTADRPPELHHVGAPRPLTRWASSTGAVRWAHTPGVPGEGQRGTWRPLAVQAFVESLHGTAGPGPVQLNLEFREPLTGTAECLPSRPGPRKFFPGEQEVPGRPAEPLRGGGSSSWVARRHDRRSPHGCWRSRSGWVGRSWPIRARGSRTVGTIAAADSIVRTHPLLPPSASSCWARLGCPGRWASTSQTPPTPGPGSWWSTRGASGRILFASPRSSTSARPTRGCWRHSRTHRRATPNGSDRGVCGRRGRRLPLAMCSGRTSVGRRSRRPSTPRGRDGSHARRLGIHADP